MHVAMHVVMRASMHDPLYRDPERPPSIGTLDDPPLYGDVPKPPYIWGPLRTPS